MKRLFRSNGKPFFTIGGQARNSSSQSSETMKKVWSGMEKMGLNTLAAPVYWSLLEPEEGVFDYSQVELLLKEAKEHGVKLILLWFGTWKNGASQYVPNWVKTQPNRFIWAESAMHNLTRTLSPFCEETKEADKRAYCKLMEYLKEYGAEEILLGIQVENEPGLLGTPRDYSEAGEAFFQAEVPDEVVKWVKEADICPVKEIWRENGSKEAGTWPEVFGFHAEEMASAYGVATYINEITRAGKEIYYVPAYVNVWLGEMYNRVAGIDYPSGGATSRVLDFWKFLAPDIDAICPDVYFSDYRTYFEVVSKYSRQDNILYIPESPANHMNAMNILNAMAQYDLSGIHFFGVDDAVDRQGELRQSYEEYKGLVAILNSMKPMIEKYQGTDKFFVVTQYEGGASQYLDFGDFSGRAVHYLPNGDYRWEPHRGTDTNHRDDKVFQKLAKGVIVYVGNGEFYLSGEGFSLNLLRKKSIREMSGGVIASQFQNGRHQRYLAIEEGHFDENGCYVAEKMRTGDECDTGIWMDADVGVVHVQIEM